jgi:F-type H+-transporting ATPase subunit b
VPDRWQPILTGPNKRRRVLPQLDFSTFPNQIFWLARHPRGDLPDPDAPRPAAHRRACWPNGAGTITNDIAAAEELKLKAQQAETVYNRALAEARSEAERIAADTRAVIQADLDKAIAKADAEIAARTAESEKAIGAINAGAAEAVKAVAQDAAVAVVAAMGMKADPAKVAAAVASRLKGVERCAS